MKTEFISHLESLSCRKVTVVGLEMLAQGSAVVRKANREIIRERTKIKQEYCAVTV